MNEPIFNLGEIVYYYNKWSNEIEKGEIINIRQAHLNWDYKIRYYIQKDLIYQHWIEEKHISRDDQVLFEFLD